MARRPQRHLDAGIEEDALELRQNEADEDRERAEAGDGNQARIDESRFDVVAEPRHALEIFREAMEHGLEIAARLPGLDHAAIEGGKLARGGQRLRERAAASHPFDHAIDVPTARGFVEAKRRRERPIERQRRIEQHRKFARERRELHEGRSAPAPQLEADGARPHRRPRRLGADRRQAGAVELLYRRPRVGASIVPSMTSPAALTAL